nr:ribose-phosphate diphosphokinase [Bacteroidota bacterium]
LHAALCQGAFAVTVDNLHPSSIFATPLAATHLTDLIIAAPDAGGSKRANAYAKYLDVDLALCYKQRKKANEIASMTIIGDVKGKDVVIIDDMVDTAGTLCKSAELFIEHGAKSVRAICTHAILSGPAYERIEESVLEELIVTNTIPAKRKSDKIKVLSVADMFADVIKKTISFESISDHFVFANQ